MLYSKSWNIISLSILANTVTSSVPIIVFSYMLFRSSLYIPLVFTVIVLLFLNKKLRLQFQNKLEILFDKQYLTEEEISDVLKISQTALKGLLKTLTVYKEGYKREDVIRTCMGGKMYE